MQLRPSPARRKPSSPTTTWRRLRYDAVHHKANWEVARWAKLTDGDLVEWWASPNHRSFVIGTVAGAIVLIGFIFGHWSVQVDAMAR